MSDCNKHDAKFWVQPIVTLCAVCLGGLITYAGQCSDAGRKNRKEFLVSLADKAPTLLGEIDSCVESISNAGFLPLEQNGSTASFARLETEINNCVVILDRAVLTYRLFADTPTADHVLKFQNTIVQMRTDVSQTNSFSASGQVSRDRLQEIAENGNSLSSDWRKTKSLVLTALNKRISEGSDEFR